VRPGKTAKAYLAFLNPGEHVGRIEPGTIFLVRDGNRVVGYGRVTRLIGLEASAARLGSTIVDVGLSRRRFP
jgi:hypothetical protein